MATKKLSMTKTNVAEEVPQPSPSPIEAKLDRIVELLEQIASYTGRVPKPFDWSKVVKD